jgi:uncharacterized protein YjdB
MGKKIWGRYVLGLFLVSVFLTGCDELLPLDSRDDDTPGTRRVTGVNILYPPGDGAYANEVVVGGTLQLRAEIYPDDAANKAVRWRSFSDGIASVDAEGLVTGLAHGGAEIEVTTEDGGYKAAAWIYVSPSPGSVNGVWISYDTGPIGIGGTLQLQAVISPDDALNKAVSWESLSPDIARVNAEGLVTGLAEGTAQIRVSTEDGGYMSSATITVSASVVIVTGVSITPPSQPVMVGRALQLQAVVAPDNASNKGIIWESLNPEIAVVNQAGGLVRGVAPGTAKIKVTTAEGQKTAETELTVEAFASKSFQFDMSGARAIYAVDTSDSGRRMRALGDSSDSDPLVKVLADDTVASVADFSMIEEAMGSLPAVKFMIHSPVPGKKDIYISFNTTRDLYYREIVDTHTGDSYPEGEGGWQWVSDGYYEKYETKYIGSFIHIREDGSYTGIIKNESTDYPSEGVVVNSGGDPVIFDAAGNLYFMFGDYNTTVINKYDPAGGTLTPVTAAVPGTRFDSMAISADGALLFVNGGRYGSNTKFLRVISTLNPDLFENVFYDTSGSRYINSFVLRPDTKELYISGYNVTMLPGSSGYSSGLFRVKIPDTNPAHWEWSLLKGTSTSFYGSSLITSEYIQGWYDEDEKYHTGYSLYKFRPEFEKEDGTVDTGTVMEYLYSFFCSDHIEFRYGGKTNGEALELLEGSQDGLLALAQKDAAGFIRDHIFRTGGGALDDTVTGISFISISKFAVDDEGGIWGFTTIYDGVSRKTLVKILDAQGKRDFYIPAPFAGGRTIVDIQPDGSYVYYCADIKEDGTESGVQNIYRFSVTDPDHPENLLDRITRNKSLMEIYSWAVSGDYLYFSATQNRDLFNAKIYLPTMAYNELDFGKKVTSVLAY